MTKRILIMAAVLLGLSLSGCSSTPAPVYTDVTIRINDSKMTQALSVEDLADFYDLALQVGKIIYEIDEGYSPDQAIIDQYLTDTTSKYLTDIATAYEVKCNLIGYQIMDIIMVNDDTGDILLYYLLEYGNKQLITDTYYFITNLAISKTNGRWMCTAITSKGSAPVSEYLIVRDDFTGLCQTLKRSELK